MSCRLGKLTPQHLHRRATPESAPAREAAAEAALQRDGRRTAAGRTMSRPRARLRPKTARHGARRCAPATRRSTAHPGHRPQQRVRVGRARGRACAALRRGPTHLVVASMLSRSVPGCQHMANAADSVIPVASGCPSAAAELARTVIPPGPTDRSWSNSGPTRSPSREEHAAPSSVCAGRKARVLARRPAPQNRATATAKPGADGRHTRVGGATARAQRRFPGSGGDHRRDAALRRHGCIRRGLC